MAYLLDSPLAPKSDPEQLAADVNRLYQEYRISEFTDWQQNAVNNEAFLNNAQFPIDVAQELQDQGKPILIDNETLVTVNQLANVMTTNNPGFKTIATEDSDVKDAKYMSDLLQWIYSPRVSNGGRQVRRLVKDLLATGKCVTIEYVDTMADNGRGEIKFKALDPKRHLVSPNSQEIDASDSKFDIVANTISKSTIDQLYPQLKNKALQGMEDRVVPDPEHVFAAENQQIQMPTQVETRYLALEVYEKRIVTRIHIQDGALGFDRVYNDEEWEVAKERLAFKVVRGNSTDIVINEADFQDLDNVYKNLGLEKHSGYFHLASTDRGEVQIPGVIGSEETPGMVPVEGTNTQLVYTNLEELVKDNFLFRNDIKSNRIRRILSIGGIIVDDEILEREDSPVKCIMINHNRNPYPIADITLIRPLQEQLNAVEMMIINYSQNLVNMKGFFPEGNTKLINELRARGNKPGSEWFEYNAGANGAMPIFPPIYPMPTEFYRQKADIKQQMQRIIGVSSFQEGDATNAPRTKGATILLNELSNTGIKAKQALIGDLLTRVANGILDMAPQVYTERKLLRIMAPDKPVTITVINDPVVDSNAIKNIANDVSIAKFDVMVVTDSMLPSSRQKKLDRLFTFYQAGIPGLQDEIIRSSDIDNAEEIIARNNLVLQQQQQMAAMQEEIKKLSGDLQTAERQTKNAKMDAEISNFKAKTKGIESDIKAEAKVTKNNLTNIESNKQSNKEKE